MEKRGERAGGRGDTEQGDWRDYLSEGVLALGEGRSPQERKGGTGDHVAEGGCGGYRLEGERIALTEGAPR